MDISLRYAPFNFERDPTEPTWVLGVRYTLPVGAIKTGENTGVGEGIHAIDLSTTISRRSLSLAGTLLFVSRNLPFPEGGFVV